MNSGSGGQSYYTVIPVNGNFTLPSGNYWAVLEYAAEGYTITLCKTGGTVLYNGSGGDLLTIFFRVKLYN